MITGVKMIKSSISSALVESPDSSKPGFYMEVVAGF